MNDENRILTPATIDVSSITDFKINRLSDAEKIDLLNQQYKQIIDFKEKYGKYESLIDKIDSEPASTLQIIWFILKSTPKIIKIFWYITQILEVIKMKNLKSTFTAIITALAYIANLVFNLQIPTDAILVIGTFFIGLFASDAKPLDLLSYSNLKTTFTALLTVIAYVCITFFKLPIPTETITLIGLTIIGLFAKDASNNG